jgi:hypothetical protein
MLAVLALFLHAYARERAGVERAALDVSRALMQAVDRELISARAALEALATSPSLDHGDLRAFHAQVLSMQYFGERLAPASSASNCRRMPAPPSTTAPRA